jgi:hypothetical protein
VDFVAGVALAIAYTTLFLAVYSSSGGSDNNSDATGGISLWSFICCEVVFLLGVTYAKLRSTTSKLAAAVHVVLLLSAYAQPSLRKAGDVARDMTASMGVGVAAALFAACVPWVDAASSHAMQRVRFGSLRAFSSAAALVAMVAYIHRPSAPAADECADGGVSSQSPSRPQPPQPRSSIVTARLPLLHLDVRRLLRSLDTNSEALKACAADVHWEWRLAHCLRLLLWLVTLGPLFPRRTWSRLPPPIKALKNGLVLQLLPLAPALSRQ